MRTGAATLIANGNEKQAVCLRLSEDCLQIQKQEMVYTHSPLNHVNSAALEKERVVHIRREKPGGLGLSVKGGAEHNLPVLISRIFKDQAADRSGQLFVGDAILEVNNVNVESLSHDEAVMVLKKAGDSVALRVKYFQPASYFLMTKGGTRTGKCSVKDDENNTMSSMEENSNEYQPDRQWTTIISIPLLCAYVSRFKDNSTEMCVDTFEVISLDGTSSAKLQFDDRRSCDDWTHSIRCNIAAQNNLSISLTNGPLLPQERVMYMCWMTEKCQQSETVLEWRRSFFSLKGSDVSFYDMPPVKMRDWVKCEKSCKVFECVFKILKGSELVDNRPNSFVIETADGCGQCLNVETHEELLKLEQAWYKATYLAVKHLSSRTFGCMCKGRLCGLTLDFTSGFCLYDSESKSCIWTYKFSQLKSSSDNGQTKLKLQFLNSNTEKVDSWELECTEMRLLLYCIHAFLSAKLASVDPIFLINL